MSPPKLVDYSMFKKKVKIEPLKLKKLKKYLSKLIIVFLLILP